MGGGLVRTKGPCSSPVHAQANWRATSGIHCKSPPERGGRGEQGVGAGGGGSARLSLVLGPQLRDIDRAQPTVTKVSHWLSRGAEAKATQARAGTLAGLAR